MGLRGTTICFPLIGALFFKEYIRPKAVVIAIGFAPLATILWAIFMKDLLDPLYVGMILSALIITAGSFEYSLRKDIAKNK